MTLGEIAFQAWVKERNLAHLLFFETLSKEMQQAWEKAAEAAVQGFFEQTDLPKPLE